MIMLLLLSLSLFPLEVAESSFAVVMINDFRCFCHARHNCELFLRLKLNCDKCDRIIIFLKGFHDRINVLKADTHPRVKYTTSKLFF
mmetsp:Transcript_18587/g.38375  ORF Transcript_18587/g.38375 Transcript_18587/m.38375 type:complete len:87 (-) Transcript_18587:6-266(-)